MESGGFFPGGRAIAVFPDEAIKIFPGEGAQK